MMGCSGSKEKQVGNARTTQFSVTIDTTSGKCPAGERRGEENIANLYADAVPAEESNAVAYRVAGEIMEQLNANACRQDLTCADR